MGWVVTVLLLLPASSPWGLAFERAQASAEGLLPGRVPALPLVVVESRQPESFDLIDLREEQRERAAAKPSEVQPRSIFGIKQHVGLAAGYDNQNVHASIGYYITVAEWGRWNFGTVSPALGIARYGVFDEQVKLWKTATDYTVMISLASIHFRGGRFESLGLNWYVTVEQVFDMRANMPGSQVGVSLSRK